MRHLDVVTAALVIIGALNWGLAGAFHLDRPRLQDRPGFDSWGTILHAIASSWRHERSRECTERADDFAVISLNEGAEQLRFPRCGHV
jgi:hypothetical protein